ncbi:hypothetical protein Bca52824_038114 [Brassica carinata]|uniref:Uncharacterized protein n=1 Tax=Brassica carinata TaxID=52824 RepID=A0A8X7RRA4_BRACI|nr:hypothetical protein Bca52824_038114 [Brassica carinata]
MARNWCDELTMEDKLSIVQEQRAKNAELKAKSRALKLKKLSEAAKDVGVIVPIAPASAASASARVNPFSESTQYFDWLNLEKTYRELSPAEQQYFVTASLAGHFE